MFDTTLRDLRGAARALRRAPSLTLSAVICLGLGLGSTAAISSAIDRALVRPLPFRDPDRLVTVYRTTPQFKGGPFAPPNYVDLARGTRSLSSLAAMGRGGGILTVPDGALAIRLTQVTGNLFSMLGARAVRGRLLQPGDEEATAGDVAVIGEELWRTRWGADPGIVGKAVDLDGRPSVVVGIVPAGFAIPNGSDVMRADVWTPLRFSPQQMAERRSNFLRVVGRLADGATVEGVEAEMATVFAGIVSAFPQLAGDGVNVVPLQADGVRAVRTPLLLLFGAVCMVLLIAATNVASLLLARGIQRQREVAVRTALGAGRRDVMRPVLAEALLLSLIGATAGLALAWGGVRTIGALASEKLPQLAGLTVDVRVAAFALILALVVTVACGAVPAWRGTAVQPQDALRAGRGGGTGSSQHRALGALVTGEVALSLILLTGAGLVMKGFARLATSDPGFDPRPVLTLAASVSAQRYPDMEGVRKFLEPTLERIQQIPGVTAVGGVSLLPYDNWGWNFNIQYEGQPGNDPTHLPIVENRVATPGFFRVTGQRLVAGRMLRESDDERRATPSVVVVNEALVRRDFAGADPIGKRFHTSDTTFSTIVGVVSDIRNFGPFDSPHPEIYSTFRQAGSGSTGFSIMVKVRGSDPAAVAAQVRTAVRSVDPGAAITDLLPMHDVMARSIGRPRFYLTLLGTFAVIAVLLAVAGLYGVMSYVVEQRTRELGIRGALGSPASRILALVARRGMGLVAAGLVLGLLGSTAVTRLMQGMLYGVSPLDPSTWLLATALLALVGILATLVPAVRATRVDPLVAIRAE